MVDGLGEVKHFTKAGDKAAAMEKFRSAYPDRDISELRARL